MHNRPAPHGLFVPLATPFTTENELATDALEKHAHTVIDDGAAGIVALGTTGEPATLTAHERDTVVDICAEVCRERRATLIVGAGTNDTAHTIEGLRDLAERGIADAALVPVPPFTRPSEAGVRAHFTAITAETDLPLIVYNIPSRTGQKVGAATMRELAAMPGVVGVKQAVGSVDHGTVALLGDPISGFAVLAGDDAFAPALLGMGAAGGIMASANVATREFGELVSAWHRGDLVRARTLGRMLPPVADALFAEPNPAVIKGVLHAWGRIPSPAVRLPLLTASQHTVERALSMLNKTVELQSASTENRCG